MRKAQIMLEFVIAISVVVFVCGFAFYVSAQKNDEFEYLKTKESAGLLCNSVSSTIDEVWAMGNGASIFMSVPQKINFVSYSAQITSQKSLIVSFLSNSLICSFTADVTDGTSANFTLPTGNIKFFNDNSKVVMSVV